MSLIYCLRALSVLADRTNRSFWGFWFLWAQIFLLSISGASSRTTWQLVPEMPKELTPARLGVSFLGFGQSVSLVLTYTGELAQSMRRFGVLKWIEAGIFWCFRDRAALARPNRPEASAVWPRLDLTEPMGQNCFFWV